MRPIAVAAGFGFTWDEGIATLWLPDGLRIRMNVNEGYYLWEHPAYIFAPVPFYGSRPFFDDGRLYLNVDIMADVMRHTLAPTDIRIQGNYGGTYGFHFSAMPSVGGGFNPAIPTQEALRMLQSLRQAYESARNTLMLAGTWYSPDEDGLGGNQS